MKKNTFGCVIVFFPKGYSNFPYLFSIPFLSSVFSFYDRSFYGFCSFFLSFLFFFFHQKRN